MCLTSAQHKHTTHNTRSRCTPRFTARWYCCPTSGQGVRRQTGERGRWCALPLAPWSLEQSQIAAWFAPLTQPWPLLSNRLTSLTERESNHLTHPLPHTEDPDEARAGGIFHLQASAALGCTLAQAILARAHMDLEPSSTQFAALIKEVGGALQALGWLARFDRIVSRMHETHGCTAACRGPPFSRSQQ